MAHMLIQWVIWHKCIITPTALLPCGYARANRAVNVPNAVETNSSGTAWRPLAEEKDTPSVQRLYYNLYWCISSPQLFIPIEKDIHNHILSGSTEIHLRFKTLLGPLRDRVTATTYWQCTKDLCVVSRLSGNTAASPEPGSLRAVIHQSDHIP